MTIHLPLFIDTSQVSWEFPYGTGEFDDNKRAILWQVRRKVVNNAQSRCDIYSIKSYHSNLNIEGIRKVPHIK